ncbi:MAG: NAD(P)-binding domain-containing protein, partial [Dehalococcoidia bacterium]
MNRRDYKISIVGSGSVGKAIGKVLAKYGYQVIFCDVDRERLEELASQGYQVSEKPAEVDADISFICVPTPNKDGRFDGSYVKAALSRLRDISSSRAGSHAIIIKSTVLPEILEQINGHGVCLNPEFLRSEMPEEDFENQPVVIGCIDPKATEVLKEFYQDFKKRAKKDVEVLVTD